MKRIFGNTCEVLVGRPEGMKLLWEIHEDIYRVTRRCMYRVPREHDNESLGWEVLAQLSNNQLLRGDFAPCTYF
jgi:hypothetical protein